MSDFLVQRRTFDFQILADMQCPVFRSEGYVSTDDLRLRRRQVVDPADAGKVSKYRFIFSVPTLVGPGKTAPVTEVGIDTDVVDYPRKEPSTWILSTHVPWSPHFRSNSPICLGGEFWTARGGYVTLGHLAVHVARLLNWDEKARGNGYQGWSPEAIAYHAEHYGDRPLDAGMEYPALPIWLHALTDTPAQEFRIIADLTEPPTFRVT